MDKGRQAETCVRAAFYFSLLGKKLSGNAAGGQKGGGFLGFFFERFYFSIGGSIFARTLIITTHTSQIPLKSLFKIFLIATSNGKQFMNNRRKDNFFVMTLI